LKDGELVQQGAPDEILLSPADDYVEAFVKDVNRARALSVENVMQPPAYRITATTIDEALKQMKGVKQDYAYHVTDEGYQGVVTRESLIDAQNDEQKDLEQDIYEEVPTVSADSFIEEILPESLVSDYSLPVVDKEGNLQGELERSAVADIFTDSTDEQSATSSSKNEDHSKAKEKSPTS
jgi:glycine betaine/proline transport system ATP-binding protein